MDSITFVTSDGASHNLSRKECYTVKIIDTTMEVSQKNSSKKYVFHTMRDAIEVSNKLKHSIDISCSGDINIGNITVSSSCPLSSEILEKIKKEKECLDKIMSNESVHIKSEGSICIGNCIFR